MADDPAGALRARLDAIDEQIAKLAEERERTERALAVLTNQNQSDTDRSMSMDMVDRMRHSTGAKSDPRTRAIREAVRAKGHTMRSYAEAKRKQHRGSDALRWSQVSLTRWATGAEMPMRFALEIQADLGLEATRKNWPGLDLE